MAEDKAIDVPGASDSASDLQNSSEPPIRKRSIYNKIYGFFGFDKAYNFPLYVIFAGAMLGFSLSRLQDYNYDEILAFQIIPGAWMYFGFGSYRVGFIMHLAGTLPSGILCVLQFTPAIRHSSILFHRINGYVVIALALVGNIGAAIVLRHHDNGTRVATQTAEGILIIMTTIALAISYYNVKRLQIDQHRAWMLRAWFYFGTIISLRIMLEVSGVIITTIAPYYTVWDCEQLDFVYKQFGIKDGLARNYPQCLEPGGTLDGRVVVKAEKDPSQPAGIGATIAIPFGAILWIAIALHLIGVEIYLNFTPRETARLRKVSYEKQLAAGYKNPGDAGLTAFSLGGDSNRFDPNDV